jgi:PAS domain S-box-containing protein
LDALDNLVVVMDTRGRVVRFNPACERATGRAADEVLGQLVWDVLIPPEHVALVKDVFAALRSNRRHNSQLPLRHENPWLTRDGSRRLVSWSNTAVRDGRGAVRYVVGTGIDVTEQRWAEAALRESEQRFRAMADGAPVLIWVNGPDGCEFVNRAYLDFVGVASEGAVRGYDWAQHVHPDDRDGYVCAYLDAVARRATFRALFRFRRHDGEYRWMESAGVPRTTESGTWLGYIGSTHDITDLKLAIESRREGEARLRAILDSAVDAVVTIDERGVIDSVNPAVERLFGYPSSELIGRNVRVLMPEPYRDAHDGYIRDYLRTGRARVIGVGREVVARRKDGHRFAAELSVSEFRSGERRMFTGILRDVSERRRLEQEVLEASAGEQRRIGQDLHDGLCQQLAGAAFGLEVLTRRLSATAADEVPEVRKLADLLDHALTEARALAHGLNPIDLRAGGLPAALDKLATWISQAFRVRCRFRAGPALAPCDATTATHLFRIAQEAVNNAIRHGRASRVTISLSTGRGAMTLRVDDNGIGIASTPPGGAGMGLQIMAYRARLVGASLDVRPRLAGGTRVACKITYPKRPPGPSTGADGEEHDTVKGHATPQQHGAGDWGSTGEGRSGGEGPSADERSTRKAGRAKGPDRRRPPDRSRAAR